MNAVETEAARRVELYAITRIPHRLSGEGLKPLAEKSPPAKETPVSGPIPMDWNPGSPISARTLVIAAENRLEQINEAILVCAPPSMRCTAADLNLADVEILMNDHIKGWFFLVKELSAVFRAQGKVTLCLAYSETSGASGKDDAVDFLGSAAVAAFRSLTRSLLDSAANEPYLTLGFSGIDAGDETGFAAFIFKLLDEGNRRSNGKLHKYGKLSFFR